jgi:hypothetical protein
MEASGVTEKEKVCSLVASLMKNREEKTLHEPHKTTPATSRLDHTDHLTNPPPCYFVCVKERAKRVRNKPNPEAIVIEY